MRRRAKWATLGLLALVVVVSAPIVWIETRCTARREPQAARGPLVADNGYVRRETDSYLSFPEWHIVYAYEDLAGVLRAADASRFAYRGQIDGFWRSLCRLTRVASARGEIGTDTKVMLYTIGWSFTAELGLKGAYETTAGRLFEWLRGPERTEEDIFVAQDMQAYADFLRQTPWYAYPFASRLATFWRTTPWAGPHVARKIERRVAVTLEYAVKAGYGALIGWASGTALGAADLEILTVVRGLEASDVAADPRITIVRALPGGGLTLIRTPRYQAYTEILAGLARRGRDVVEIAGNRRILVTALMPRGLRPQLPEATELFQLTLQSRPERRLGLEVSVEGLAAAIRVLESSRAVLEHVYDY